MGAVAGGRPPSRDSYLNIGHATNRLLFAKRRADGRLQYTPEQVCPSISGSPPEALGPEKY